MPGKTFKVLQWNCRSITTNHDQLVQQLSEERYNILSLQSLNVRKEKLPKLANYFFPPVIQKADKDEKINVAIYIREDEKYASCASPVPPDIPGLYACAVKVQVNQNTLVIVSVYLPQGPSDLNTEWLRLI